MTGRYGKGFLCCIIWHGITLPYLPTPYPARTQEESRVVEPRVFIMLLRGTTNRRVPVNTHVPQVTSFWRRDRPVKTVLGVTYLEYEHVAQITLMYVSALCPVSAHLWTKEVVPCSKYSASRGFKCYRMGRSRRPIKGPRSRVGIDWGELSEPYTLLAHSNRSRRKLCAELREKGVSLWGQYSHIQQQVEAPLNKGAMVISSYVDNTERW